MKVFIINLKSSPERRAKMEQQLAQLNLAHEFIDAIDGYALSNTEINNYTCKLNYAFLPGEIGCALSHQKAYKKMITEEIDTALILEDDVIINSDIEKIINKVTLDTTTAEILLLSRVNKFYTKQTKQLFSKYSIHKTQQATTAHSYIINLAAAKSLLDALFPVWMVSDKWSLFEDLSLAKIYSVIPHPVSLSDESNSSTINQHKNDCEINNKKKEIWELLMKNRPFSAKIRHKYRRAITPIFNKIANQGKG